LLLVVVSCSSTMCSVLWWTGLDCQVSWWQCWWWGRCSGQGH